MAETIEIQQYTPAHKAAWDEFVAGSKNGTFLFYRDYLEYHGHQFTDYSLLFYRKGKLVALLPANREDQTIYSHGGLTYGGILTKRTTKIRAVLSLFDHLSAYLKHQEVNRLVYKAIPYIYHQVPAQEDLYALFRHGASLFRRDVSSTIDLNKKFFYSRNRTGNLKKAAQTGTIISQSTDFSGFMALLKAVLQEKYQTVPTHTVAEIIGLAKSFPGNITLYVARQGEQVIAGTIIYESEQVAHAQYIAASETGKEAGALELLMDFLIQKYAGKKQYFDFGISTEKMGRILNEGLIESKERYGARAVVYDSYELHF